MLGRTWEGDSPRLRVSRVVYPKVALSIGLRLVLFHEELQGPLSLEERKIKNVTEFVAVNQLTGSITVLTSYQTPIDELMKDYEPLARHAPRSSPSGDGAAD